MIMQTAFFALTKVIPVEEAIAHLKTSVVENYGFMGEDIVAMNNKAIEMGATAFEKIDVPFEWSKLEIEREVVDNSEPEFIKNILRPISSKYI